MTTYKTLSDLLTSMMDEFEDDYVGLWSVIKQVQRTFPNDQPAAVRSKTLSLLLFLLEMGYIEAGFPNQDRHGFDPWRMKPLEVITRIESEWKQPEPYPTVGEIVWFTAPSSRLGEVELAASDEI